MEEKKKIRTQRFVILGLLVVLVSMLAGFAIASATIPSANGTIGLCRKLKNGNARVIDSAAVCKTTEQKVTVRSYDPIGVVINGFAAVPVAMPGTARHFSSVTRLGTGSYTVTFDRDVSTCIPNASPYGAGAISATAATVGGANVQVNTFNGGGSDDIFDVTVTC